MHSFHFEGVWEAVCENPDGSLAWRALVINDVVDAALDDLLNTYFNGATQHTGWAMGLIDASGFTALDASDTMPSHAGWAEFTGYTQGTRAGWTPSVGGGIATAVGVFTFNSTGSIAGLFLTSSPTKGGASGQLWSTGLFGLAKACVPGQTLRLTYNLRAVGGG